MLAEKLQVLDSRKIFGQGFRGDRRKIGSKNQKCIYAGRKNYKSQIADNVSARASAGINEKMVLKIKNVYMLAEKKLQVPDSRQFLGQGFRRD